MVRVCSCTVSRHNSFRYGLVAYYPVTSIGTSMSPLFYMFGFSMWYYKDYKYFNEYGVALQ